MANFIGLSNDKTQRINKRWNCQNSFKGNENCVFSRFERGGTIRYSLYKETSESLNEKEDMKKIVKVAMKKLYNWVFFKNGFDSLLYNFPSQCPPDEDLNDFLANHVVDFYTRAKLVSQWTKRFNHFYLSISFHQKIVFHVQVYSTVLIFF